MAALRSRLYAHGPVSASRPFAYFATMTFRIKRIYQPATANDGVRVLVDRLWPRGVSKFDAHLTQWLKEAAPSDSLRRWFDHRPERFDEFSIRYRQELAGNPAL